MNHTLLSSKGQQQRGIALIVVIIMILIITILGISGVRTLVMQERMAANGLDRTLALQSAERVLLKAEGIAQAQSLASPMNTAFPQSVPASKIKGTYVPSPRVCSASRITDNSPCDTSAIHTGLCSQPEPGCIERWADSSFTGWADVTAVASSGAVSADVDANLSVNLHQQYIIEFLGTNYPCNADKTAAYQCTLYRITVRTQNPSVDRALVLLQSYYLSQP